MTRRLRVAIVAHEVETDQGSERVIKELIRRGRGEVDFVVVSNRLEPALRPHVGWRRAWTVSRPYKLKFLLFFVTGALQLLRARADLVHVHAVGPTVPNRADLTSVHLCREVLFEAFGIFGPHAVPRLKRILPRIHVALERWCNGRSRMLAALSEGSRRDLVRLYPDAPVVVTPNGVDVERFRPDSEARADVRAGEGAEENDVVAVFLANAWHRKGLDVAIEALALAARDQQGPDWLWVVGYGNSESYRALAQRHGIADRVRFLGARGEAERYLQAADLFVMPSFNEEMSLAALEAAACGLPVLTTPVNGMEELIGDGEAGLIVERKPEAVAAGLARLAGDGELRRRLGETARHRAESRFGWERSVDSVLAAYGELREQPEHESAFARRR